MSTLGGVRTVAAPAAVARRAPAVADCWWWELEKMAAQWRTRAVAGACVLAPFAVAALLRGQSAVPADTLFGRWVHESGFATPLVILGFVGTWALPLLTSVVAGDLLTGEDHDGTWPALLTRSRSRSQVFAGKALAAATWSVVMVVLLAAAALAAGVLLLGHQPLVGLGGQLVDPGRSVATTIASWAAVLPTVLGFAALGLLFSALSRHGAIGIAGPFVVGLLMQLVNLIGPAAGARPYLLSSGFDAWHGLWAAHPYAGPIGAAAITAAVYAAVATGLAWQLLLRREFTHD